MLVTFWIRLHLVKLPINCLCVSDFQPIHMHTQMLFILKDVNFAGSSSENVSEGMSCDRGASGSRKPWQNKYNANWREENGDRSARGKWGGQYNEGRSRGDKWNNSRGDNMQQRKPRQGGFAGSDSGSSA